MSDEEEEARRKAEAGRKYRQRDGAKARERELAADRRLTNRGRAVVKKISRIRSGKSATAAKRSPNRDDRIVLGIEAALTDGDVTTITAKRGPTVTDYRSRERRVRAEIITPGGIHKKASTFWTPTWDHAGDKLKQMAWGQVMHINQGCTMTVHLGDDVLAEAQLRNTKEPGSFTTYIRNRISDELRKAFTPMGLKPPDFFFTIETAHGIEPHVHGALMVSPNYWQSAEDALRKAGGLWKGRERQVLLAEITSAVGWVRYMSKWREQSRIALEDPRLVAATRGLRKLARDWYDEARRSGAPLT